MASCTALTGSAFGPIAPNARSAMPRCSSATRAVLPRNVSRPSSPIPRTSSARMHPRVSEDLLEPVVGVALVVEGGDLAVAGRPVQPDRLGERPVGLQVQHPHPVLAGAG